MIDSSTISQAARLLGDAAPNASVFLYGSYARGDAGEDSDLDFLIVEAGPVAARSEKVRLRKALVNLRVPVDLLVVDEATFQEWLQTPGMIETKPSPPGTGVAAIHFLKPIQQFLSERGQTRPGRGISQRG